MKKYLSIICLCFLSMFIFVGCGVSGNGEPVSIEFQSNNGVFYVDYDVPTELAYKVYPSTAAGYTVNYSIEYDESIASYFSFSKGVIRVINKDFISLKVKISLDNMEDTCTVVLKEYPKSISFEGNGRKTIESGSVQFLELKGLFKGEEEDVERLCQNGEYNYRVESKNSSVIEVVDEKALMVKSTGRSGSSTIDVKILNCVNQEVGLTASITLDVEDNIDSSFVTFGNKFVVKNNQTKNLEFIQDESYLISASFFDELGFLVDSKFNIKLSNNDVFEVVELDGNIYLKAKAEGSVKVTILSSRLDAGGNYVAISFFVSLQNS